MAKYFRLINEANFLYFSVGLFLINFGDERLDKGYIRIEFGADPAKPFPVITFYLPQSIDTSYKEDHIHNIEISESEFSLIRKIIMPMKSTEPKTTKDVLFTISEGSKEQYFWTRDRQVIIHTLDSIATIFKYDPIKKMVQDDFIDFKRKVKFYIRENKIPFARDTAQ